MNAPHRRGACPGLSDPMPTGDGLLARLVPAGGTIAFDAFASLCAAARRHGNGILEITQRGSIQVRGLNSASAPIFAGAVAALKIGTAQKTPVIAGPLSGLDPREAIDAAALADELRVAIANAPRLSALGAKISVLIDGGGTLHLDALSADLRLCAERCGRGTIMHIAVGGDGTAALALGAVSAGNAVAAALRLLEAIAARGSATRARDIVRDAGVGRFAIAIAEFLVDAKTPPTRAAADPIGVHTLHDGKFALGVGLAFGHAHASALESLIDAAARAGACGLRAAPARALLLIGLAPENIGSFAAAAELLGFVVQPDDPRHRIAACPGAPLCASGLIPARSLAAEIARRLSPARGGVAIHVSGCAKGCAHAAPCALTIVGTERGCGIVHDGSARDKPLYHVDPAKLPAEAERLVAATREAIHG